MIASHDAYLNTQINQYLHHLGHIERDVIWIDQRIEYIRDNLRLEYSIGDILADYADANPPQGVAHDPKRWCEYDSAINSAVLDGNCKPLQAFAEKAIEFQAKRELEELKRSQ